MPNKTTILFAILAIIFCLSTLVEPYPFNWLIKILPMLVLIFTVSLHVVVKSSLPFLANNQSSNDNGKSVTMLLIALVFSTCGDILLAMGHENFFIFGLGAFLIGHIFFIFSFKPFIKQKLSYLPLYFIPGLTLFSLMAGNLNELFIPVLVYMLVLLCMAFSTLLSTKRNKWLIIGGISFAISDSLIGVNKFYFNIPYSHLWIMISYYFAQYCLVNGVLLATNEKRQLV